MHKIFSNKLEQIEHIEVPMFRTKFGVSKKKELLKYFRVMIRCKEQQLAAQNFISKAELII